MNRQQLTQQSERELKTLLKANLPPDTPVHLFGSRARGDARWNSDYDIWIDCEPDLEILSHIAEAIEESVIPFKVDLITTRQLKGAFATLVHKDAIRWI